MSSPLLRSILSATVLLFGCSPLQRAQLADYEVLDESESSSTTSSGWSATTSATDDSASSEASTSWTPTTGGTDTDTTTGGDQLIVTVDDHLFTPNPITKNGAIDVTVWSDTAEGIRMELDDGSVVELLPSAAGEFEGEILALSGLHNGERNAVVTPWAGDAEGEPVIVTYEVSLGEPGKGSLWESGDVIGIGRVEAMAVLPTYGVLEMGSLLGNGTSRCYVRRRSGGGAWGPDDILYLLPDTECRAIDLEVDEAGQVFALMETETNSGWRWSLHKMESWGAPLESIGYGGKGETASALARSPGEGALAVCGSSPTWDDEDLRDASVWVYREDALGESQTFDYKVDGKGHLFDERANGCEFLDDNSLVIVGEVFGPHDKVQKINLNRRFDLFYELGTDQGDLRVAKAGVGQQSVASDVDIDAAGTRISIVGHTCGVDNCKPEGQIWTLNGQGDVGWSTSLGHHAIEAFAPHEVRSSPAGYLVVASGGLKGLDAAFTIRAFAPGQAEPLWVYTRKDVDLLHVALTVAIGPFGEVYAGGFGENGYPAVAYIFG